MEKLRRQNPMALGEKWRLHNEVSVQPYHVAKIQWRAVSTQKIPWEKIWKLDMLPRVKNNYFGGYVWMVSLIKETYKWEALNATWCGEQKEDSSHLFTSRHWSRRIWLLFPLGFYPYLKGSHSFTNWLVDRLIIEDLQVLRWVSTICWKI